VNKERESAKAGEFFAEEPDVFARGPGMNDPGRFAIRKKTAPVAIDLLESLNGVMLFAEPKAAVGIFRDGNGGGMAALSELVGEIVDMNSAIGAEVMVKNEKDVAHAERRL